jgi:hypothetical protein
MLHWSATAEPGSPAEPAPAAEPAPLSPIERIAEILEAPFLREPSFAGELSGGAWPLRHLGARPVVRLAVGAGRDAAYRRAGSGRACRAEAAVVEAPGPSKEWLPEKGRQRLPHQPAAPIGVFAARPYLGGTH